jgi:hypothetical protein
MLKFVLALTVLGMAAPSLAQNAFGGISVVSTARTIEVEALPGSLHDTMKAMSHALKSIDESDASKNAANAQAADQFVALTLHAKAFVPEEIDKMPSAERAGAKARYDKMLDETAALGRSLADAFRKGDNAKAEQILRELKTAKKRGHGEFK